MTHWISADFLPIYANLAGLALIILLGLLLFWGLRAPGRPRHFRRGRLYKVWPRRQEFKILGISTLSEAQNLLDHLVSTYDLEILDTDLEPDETNWRLENGTGTIDLFYDDHEGARIRNVKKKSSMLFHRIMRDIARCKRVVF